MLALIQIYKHMMYLCGGSTLQAAAAAPAAGERLTAAFLRVCANAESMKWHEELTDSESRAGVDNNV